LAGLIIVIGIVPLDADALAFAHGMFGYQPVGLSKQPRTNPKPES
jgi:hypothetical protein